MSINKINYTKRGENWYHGFKPPSLRPGACETKMTSSSSLSLLEMIHVVFLICRQSFFRNLLSAVSRMIWIWADLIKVIHRSGTCRLTSLSCKIALSTLDVTVPRCFQNIFCCTPDLDGKELHQISSWHFQTQKFHKVCPNSLS